MLLEALAVMLANVLLTGACHMAKPKVKEQGDRSCPLAARDYGLHSEE